MPLNVWLNLFSENGLYWIRKWSSSLDVYILYLLCHVQSFWLMIVADIGTLTAFNMNFWSRKYITFGFVSWRKEKSGELYGVILQINISKRWKIWIVYNFKYWFYESLLLLTLILWFKSLLYYKLYQVTCQIYKLFS